MSASGSENREDDNMEVDDEDYVQEEQVEEVDDAQPQASSTTTKRKSKSKVTPPKPSKAARKKAYKSSISQESYAKAMGGLLYESLELMRISEGRPHYPDGSSPSMEQEFPGLGLDENLISTSIAKDLHFSIESCECSHRSCFDPTTQTSMSLFNYKRDLILHLMYEHLEENENQEFKCPLGCRFSHHSLFTMVEHICTKEHLNLKRWSCHLCPVAYHRLESLKDHLEFHEQEKRSHQEQEVDDDGNDLPTFKTVRDPKYTEEELQITFKNVKSNLVIAEKSFLTAIQKKQTRFIEYRSSGTQYARRCFLNGCDGEAIGGGFCPLCQALIGDTPPPFKFSKPQLLVGVNNDPVLPLVPVPPPTHYYVTQIQNSTGEWISICGNQQCCILFKEPNNLSFCSGICKKYYESNFSDAFTPPPPSTLQVITDLWPRSPAYNQNVNDSFTTHYNENPQVDEAAPKPNRHVLWIHTGVGWKRRCIVVDCTSDAQIGRLCKSCKKHKVDNPATPSPLLKRKPDDEHNFHVRVTSVNSELVFTPGDTIWTQEVYDGTNWSRKCGNWECPNICTQGNALLCRIHDNMSTDVLPRFVTRQSTYSSSSRNSSSSSSSSASSRNPSPAPLQQQPLAPPLPPAPLPQQPLAPPAVPPQPAVRRGRSAKRGSSQ